MRLRDAKKLLDNPDFAKWFGKSTTKDRWLNDKPLTLYHGTLNPTFDEFLPGTGGAAGPGIYLTSDPAKANVFAGASESKINPGKMNIRKEGGAVYPVHAKIENPYVLNIYDQEAMDYVGKGGPLRDGFDGIKIPAVDEYVVFSPTQIKSAIGNRGTFDPSDPNILRGATVATGLGASLYSPDAADAKKYKDMEKEQALEEPWLDPVNMALSAITGGGTLTMRAAQALLDPLMSYITSD